VLGGDEDLAGCRHYLHLTERQRSPI
jgi:hypothetical protein